MRSVEVGSHAAEFSELSFQLEHSGIRSLEVATQRGGRLDLTLEHDQTCVGALEVALQRTHRGQLTFEFADADVGTVEVGPDLAGVGFEVGEADELRLRSTQLTLEIGDASACAVEFGRRRPDLGIQIGDASLRAVEFGADGGERCLQLGRPARRDFEIADHRSLGGHIGLEISHAGAGVAQVHLQTGDAAMGRVEVRPDAVELALELGSPTIGGIEVGSSGCKAGVEIGVVFLRGRQVGSHLLGVGFERGEPGEARLGGAEVTFESAHPCVCSVEVGAEGADAGRRRLQLTVELAIRRERRIEFGASPVVVGGEGGQATRDRRPLVHRFIVGGPDRDQLGLGGAGGRQMRVPFGRTDVAPTPAPEEPADQQAEQECQQEGKKEFEKQPIHDAWVSL